MRLTDWRNGYLPLRISSSVSARYAVRAARAMEEISLSSGASLSAIRSLMAFLNSSVR